MDYLPIQASAVPCECVFSSAAETNTNRRNRMKPELMEALQMLKFMLKKKQLDFMEGWKVSEELLVEPYAEGDASGLDALLGAAPADRRKVLTILADDDMTAGKHANGRADGTGGTQVAIVLDD